MGFNHLLGIIVAFCFVQISFINHVGVEGKETEGKLTDLLLRIKRSSGSNQGEEQCRRLTRYDAPENGGLVCHTYEHILYCTLKCNPGYIPTPETPEKYFMMCGAHTNYTWSNGDGGAMNLTGACLSEAGSQLATGQCRALTGFDAPSNGALVCHDYQQYKYCAVRCNDGFELQNPVRFFEVCGPNTGFQWSYENGESSTRINECVAAAFEGFRIESDMFYLPGNCDQLNSRTQHTVIRTFNERVLSRVPGIEHGSVYSGRLFCHRAQSYYTKACGDLSEAERAQIREDFQKQLQDAGITTGTDGVGIVCGSRPT